MRFTLNISYILTRITISISCESLYHVIALQFIVGQSVYYNRQCYTTSYIVGIIVLFSRQCTIDNRSIRAVDLCIALQFISMFCIIVVSFILLLVVYCYYKFYSIRVILTLFLFAVFICVLSHIC